MAWASRLEHDGIYLELVDHYVHSVAEERDLHVFYNRISGDLAGTWNCKHTRIGLISCFFERAGAHGAGVFLIAKIGQHASTL